MESIENWKTGHPTIDEVLPRALRYWQAICAEGDTEYRAIFSLLSEDPADIDPRRLDLDAPLPERPDVNLLPPKERLVLVFGDLHFIMSRSEPMWGGFADWLSFSDGEQWEFDFLVEKTQEKSGVLGDLHRLLTEVSPYRDGVYWEEETAIEALRPLDHQYSQLIQGDRLWEAVVQLMEESEST